MHGFNSTPTRAHRLKGPIAAFTTKSHNHSGAPPLPLLSINSKLSWKSWAAWKGVLNTDFKETALKLSSHPLQAAKGWG